MQWKNSPRAVMAVLLSLHILAQIDRNMLLGFSPQITQDLGLNNAQYGFLVGAVWVLSFGVMAMAMGTLADRYSRTRVMAVGIFIWSLCTAASGAANSFGEMAAARFFVATGEAALVPAAVSIIADLFSERGRASAMGIFFMGIPLGIGLSFLLAGTAGVAFGWRNTFYVLGLLGTVIAIPLGLLQDTRAELTFEPVPHVKNNGSADRTSVRQHVASVVQAVRGCPALLLSILGFVLVHFAFVGMTFLQLWLVRERGIDAAGIAKQIGLIQIAFGVLGSVSGGFLSDRISRYVPGGRAGFMALLVLLCGPLMIALRFSAPGSPLFYLGLCALVFLPMSLYGPAVALIQGLSPAHLRSTLTGVTMMMINVFAIALGNLVAGAVSDRLARAAVSDPLTLTLLGTDVLTVLAVVLFAFAAKGRQSERPENKAYAH